MYKNLGSVAISEINGLKVLSYSYDEIDEATGRVVRSNIRESHTLVKTRNNSNVLGLIEQLENIVIEKMEMV